MTLFASIGSDGRLSGGFFDDAIAPPPPGAVEIDLDTHRRWRATPETLRWENGRLVDAPDTAPPPPAAPHIVSGTEFLDLFTGAETRALWNADPRLMRGAMRVMAQDSANLDSPELGALLALAVSEGVLTPAREARIASGQPPEASAETSPAAPAEPAAPPQSADGGDAGAVTAGRTAANPAPDAGPA